MITLVPWYECMNSFMHLKTLTSVNHKVFTQLVPVIYLDIAFVDG